ncbi:MAG: ERAD-associated protein [Cirrosporium novae-zelandiae]|nr:MAG: ERAD-associated protein [Cirrosporium novae-zelandiae]
MNDLTLLQTSSLALAPGNYIYSIVTCAGQLASLCSDDSLRIYNKESLKVSHVHSNIHAGVTSLLSHSHHGSHVLTTAGRDGRLLAWDPRQMGTRAVLEYRGRVILRLSQTLTSATDSAPSVDRNPDRPLTQYVECHNDDVTILHYHPLSSKTLLSGSTDGLINIYDTAVTPQAGDEDDVLQMVFNNESSVHRADWLSESNFADVYGLSHDEVFSIYPVADEEKEIKHPFGDLRSKLDCEYIVDAMRISGRSCVLAGNHTKQRLDIVPLKFTSSWDLDYNAALRLPGAHGEEVVRSLYYDEEAETAYTAGEDGQIRAWKADQAQGEGGGRQTEDLHIGRKGKVLIGLTSFIVQAQDPSQDGPRLASTSPDIRDVQPRAPAITEALGILHSIERPKAKFTRHGKPSGLIWKILYYAKEVFYILFMNGPLEHDYSAEDAQPKLSKPLSKAVQLLEDAAKVSDPEAIFLLAEMSFYGNFTYPRNLRQAFRRYSELASLNGNTTAQNMVGFLYATGIGGVVERDQAKALLYHTYAALAGNTRSELTVAFRHHSGIGTPRNCDEAAFFYKRVADKAIAYLNSGPPGGETMHRDSYRIADDEGGIYGEGASVSSSGINANKAPPNSDTHADVEDVVEYLDLMAKKGELKAMYSLGRLYYDRARELQQDIKKARKYFMDIAKRYWGRDGRVIMGGPPGIESLASKAAGYLGRMYLRGEEVEQSFERALVWFRRGIVNGDPLCQYEMGLMYLEGLGLPANASKAADFFKAAAEQDFAAAQVRLGALFLDQGDLHTANRHFEMAARHGQMEAFYYLAEINNQNIQGWKERSCPTATAYYKIVAEKAEILHSPFAEANEAYDNGDLDTAAILYMMTAEHGYEKGQANIAFILDEQKSIFSMDKLLPWKKPRTSLLRDPTLALVYWTRASKQGNYDATVKMGDYYVDGFGTKMDPEKAATCYHSAAEFQRSGQALWDLGWMHENGIGAEKDYHMAKRYYDLALESCQESYLPVKLALLQLRAKSWWNSVTHGKVKGIQEEPETKKDWSFSEWIAHFLENFEQQQEFAGYGNDGENDELNDPIPGSEYDDMDDGVFESLAIFTVTAAIAFWIYYRQQRQLNQRMQQQHQEQQQQQQQRQQQQQNAGNGAGEQGQQPPPGQDRGLFPNPNDPAFNQWVAGGVGH